MKLMYRKLLKRLLTEFRLEIGWNIVSSYCDIALWFMQIGIGIGFWKLFFGMKRWEWKNGKYSLSIASSKISRFKTISRSIDEQRNNAKTPETPDKDIAIKHCFVKWKFHVFQETNMKIISSLIHQTLHNIYKMLI